MDHSQTPLCTLCVLAIFAVFLGGTAQYNFVTVPSFHLQQDIAYRHCLGESAPVYCMPRTSIELSHP